MTAGKAEAAIPQSEKAPHPLEGSGQPSRSSVLGWRRYPTYAERCPARSFWGVASIASLVHQRVRRVRNQFRASRSTANTSEEYSADAATRIMPAEGSTVPDGHKQTVP